MILAKKSCKTVLFVAKMYKYILERSELLEVGRCDSVWLSSESKETLSKSASFYTLQIMGNMPSSVHRKKLFEGHQ